MSKLSAIAQLAAKKGNGAVRLIDHKALHLIAGAIGGYRGYTNGVAQGADQWKSLSSTERNDLRGKYGKRDAIKVFSKQQGIKGAISGAIKWHGAAKTVGSVAKFAVGQAKFRTKDVERYKASGGDGTTKGYYQYRLTRNNRASKLREMRQEKYPQKPGNGLMKDLILPTIKSHAKSSIVDYAVNNVPSAVYGKVMQNAYYNRRTRSGQSVSSVKNSSKSRVRRTSQKSR